MKNPAIHFNPAATDLHGLREGLENRIGEVVEDVVRIGQPGVPPGEVGGVDIRGHRGSHRRRQHVSLVGDVRRLADPRHGQHGLALTVTQVRDAQSILRPERIPDAQDVFKVQVRRDQLHRVGRLPSGIF